MHFFQNYNVYILQNIQIQFVILKKAISVVVEQIMEVLPMKKLFVLFIAVIMIFSLPSQVMATDVSTRTENVASWAEGDVSALTDLYTMTTYYDTNFYSGSLVKQVHLEKYCVCITYRCTIDNGSTDIVYLNITDLNGAVILLVQTD